MRLKIRPGKKKKKVFIYFFLLHSKFAVTYPLPRILLSHFPRDIYFLFGISTNDFFL